MTLNEYQTLAARTIATDDKADMESHAIYGLTAEIGELMEVTYTNDQDIEHMLKECGDICWMCAELCTAEGWFLEDIVDNSVNWARICTGPYSALVEIVMANGRLNGTFQKVLQGHRWDVNTVKQAISRIFTCITGIAIVCGTDLESVLQTNIDKLKARYPMGFSTERSLNRRDDDI